MSCYQVFFSTEIEDMLLQLAIIFDRDPDSILTEVIEERILQAALQYGIRKVDKKDD